MARTKKQIEESQEHLDEDSVSDNVDTSALEGMSKTNAMSVVMKAMADEDNWVEIFNAVQAQVGTHSKAIPDGQAQKNAASTAMKGAIKEDLEAVFGGSELSEEFKAKASTLLESAVNSRVALIEANLQEQYEEALAEEIETITEGLVEKIDEYLSYAVENWVVENEVAIDKSVRADLAESFIENLGQLFIEHNFNIPEDKVEVVDMYASKVDELEEDLNTALVENIELTNLVEELQKTAIIATISEELTSTEKEKFKTLVEGFDLDEVETYVNKLETVMEHHFNKKISPKNRTQLITEEIEYTEEQVEQEQKDTKGGSSSKEMKAFVEALKASRPIV